MYSFIEISEVITFWRHMTLNFDLQIYFSIADGDIPTGHLLRERYATQQTL